MRAIVQRVRHARVTLPSTGRVCGEIGPGMLVLLGVGQADTVEDVYYLVPKITKLRIFNDEEGKMNRGLDDIDGAILLVSQFTLYADCRKGRRPGFAEAARPPKARMLYRLFVEYLKMQGCRVETGVFQQEMAVELLNDGPVTLCLDTQEMRSGRVYGI